MSDLDARRTQRLEQIFAAFNRHDKAGVMACMTDDIVFDAAAGDEMCGRRIKGQADVGAAFATTFADMPDASWECTRHSVFGDTGLSEWIFRATLTSGDRIEAEGCDIFSFKGDLIATKSAFRKARPVLPAPAKS